MSYIINSIKAVPTELPMHEIARYMGMRSKDLDHGTIERIEKLLPSFLGAIHCKGCWMELPVSISSSTIDFQVLAVESAHLAKTLEGCTKVVLFAATIGNAADRLCRSASITSPANAVILDAMGTAAIEWFCDEICNRLNGIYSDFCLRPRYSPGYGDLALEFQTEMIRVLDTQRKIGLTLSESLMMLPQKSVTAIVGMHP